MTYLIGQSIGRYHILEQLGEGGMATVYKAYDTRLERDVAVKIIRVNQFPPATLEIILKRFEREAKALAKLSHPNIVGVIDYGEYEGIPYLVMVYLPGGTLKEKLGGQIIWGEAAYLLLPVAHALAYAHREGVIHRDVKPNNILMARSGDPMLTDFGIAKILDIRDTQTLTGSGVGIGTPEYMAPEQALGNAIDARVDIYALGVVFYEMVTGKKPFTADTPMAVVFKHISDPLPRPSEYVPDLPEAVEHVLFKALAKKPEDRYADMDDLVAVLEDLSAGQGLIKSKIAKKAALEQAEREAAKKAVLEQAEREAAEKAAREQAEHEAAEKAAREQAEREAAEKAALERAEREAAEKAIFEQAEREVAEKAAREKAERESSEKAIFEQAEREVAEKAAREKAERESAEKANLEQAEREAAEKAALEQAERAAAEKAILEQAEHDDSLTPAWQQPAPAPLKRTLPAWVKYTPVILVLLLVVFFVWLGRNSAAQIIPTITSTLTASVAVPARSLATNTAKPSSTPTASNTPKPSNTPTAIATPTLGIGSTLTRDKDGMVMVYVPEGPFTMGSDTIDEKPVHTVTLDTFWIDQTEVTNHMYALCVQTGVCQPPKQSKSSTRTDYYTDAQYEDYPVIYVHWNHANTYCKWADARLPSEAEWEKAARGPDGRTYPWGEGIDQTYANYDNNVGDTTRVGSYPTGGSPYGALDMAGNVMEWVADWYGAYPGNTVGNIDFGTKFRVLRGGPWSTTGLNPRSADRVRFSPYTTTHNLGFRCVATLKSP